MLYDMGIREKEHEVYFYERIKNKKALALFERIFNWGASKSFNDVDLEALKPVEESEGYCRTGRGEASGTGVFGYRFFGQVKLMSTRSAALR